MNQTVECCNDFHLLRYVRLELAQALPPRATSTSQADAIITLAALNLIRLEYTSLDWSALNGMVFQRVERSAVE